MRAVLIFIFVAVILCCVCDVSGQCECEPECHRNATHLVCTNGRTATRPDCSCCIVCARQLGESCDGKAEPCDTTAGLECREGKCQASHPCSSDTECASDTFCLSGACTDPCYHIQPCVGSDLEGGKCQVEEHNAVCRCPTGTRLDFNSNGGKFCKKLESFCVHNGITYLPGQKYYRYNCTEECTCDATSSGDSSTCNPLTCPPPLQRAGTNKDGACVETRSSVGTDQCCVALICTSSGDVTTQEKQARVELDPCITTLCAPNAKCLDGQCFCPPDMPHGDPRDLSRGCSSTEVILSQEELDNLFEERLNELTTDEDEEIRTTSSTTTSTTTTTTTIPPPPSLEILSFSHNSTTVLLPPHQQQTISAVLSKKKQDDFDMQWQVTPVLSGQQKYMIRGLKPNTKYLFKVRVGEQESEPVEVETQVGCEVDSVSYGVGERYAVGCKAWCTCSEAGTPECANRCEDQPAPSGCTQLPDPTDPECCFIYDCDNTIDDPLSKAKLIVTQKKFDSISLAWDNFAPPNYDGGYIAEYRQTNASQWMVREQPSTSLPPEITIRDLKPRTTYDVKVSIFDGSDSRQLGRSTEVIQVRTLDGCIYNNTAYPVHAEVLDGCRQRCSCQQDGSMRCQERCEVPFFQKGHFAHDQHCEEKPVSFDECCVLVFCSNHEETTSSLDLCSSHICGPNAMCMSNQTVSYCVCKDGYTGNPQNMEVGCLPGNTSSIDECVFNNTHVYKPGEIFFDGCESRCMCSDKYEIECQPRCSMPLLSVGSNCSLIADPQDDCCNIAVCDGNLTDSFPKSPMSFDGCTINNQTYNKHQNFSVGCEKNCTCIGNGDVTCFQRCPPINTSNSSNCVMLTDPHDVCCKVMVCDQPAVSFEVPKINDTSVNDLNGPVGDLVLLEAMALNSTTVRLKTELPAAILDSLRHGGEMYIMYSKDGHKWGENSYRIHDLQLEEGNVVVLSLEELEPDTDYAFTVRYGQLQSNKVMERTFHIGVSSSFRGCFYRNETIEAGTEFFKGCEEKCRCIEFGDVSCVPRCPDLSHYIEKGCELQKNPDDVCCDIPICEPFIKENISFSSTTTTKPPQLPEGSCLYKGEVFSPHTVISPIISGCNVSCACIYGNVECNPLCPRISAQPPPTLPCHPNEATVGPLPNNDECCWNWICPQHTIRNATRPTPINPPHHFAYFETANVSDLTDDINTYTIQQDVDDDEDEVNGEFVPLFPQHPRRPVLKPPRRPPPTRPNNEPVFVLSPDGKLTAVPPDHRRPVPPSRRPPPNFVPRPPPHHPGLLPEHLGHQRPQPRPRPGQHPGLPLHPQHRPHPGTFHPFLPPQPPPREEIYPLEDVLAGRVPVGKYAIDDPNIPFKEINVLPPKHTRPPPRPRPRPIHPPVRTRPDIPSPPAASRISDFHVTSDQPHSITVNFKIPSWTVGLPARVILLYRHADSGQPSAWREVILAEGTFQDSHLSFSHSDHNLQDNTNYDVRMDISLQNAKNRISSPVQTVQTKSILDSPLLQPLPMEVHLREEEVNSNNMKLMWEPLSEDQRRFVDAIQIQADDLDTGTIIKTELLHSSLSSYILKDLQPNTEYDVHIIFIPYPDRPVKFVPTPSISVITNKAESDAPPPVTLLLENFNLWNKNVTSTSILVAWRPFSDDERKYIDSVRLEYSLMEMPPFHREHTSFTTPIHPVLTEYRLEDLEPNSSYEISMRITGYRNYSTHLQAPQPITVHTLQQTDLSDFNINVSVGDISNDSVELTWEKIPEASQKAVYLYSVVYKSENGKQSFQSFKKPNTVNGKPRVVLKNLQPGSRYSAWLEVYLNNGKTRQSDVFTVNTKASPLPSTGAAVKSEQEESGGGSTSYYGAVVALVVIVVILILVVIALAIFLKKKSRKQDAAISSGEHEMKVKSQSAYDNPTYKNTDEMNGKDGGYP